MEAAMFLPVRPRSMMLQQEATEALLVGVPGSDNSLMEGL